MLTELLRGRWGFRGLVVSDFGSIPELIAHGVAADEAHAARLAIAAGIDIDMMGFVYSGIWPTRSARAACRWSRWTGGEARAARQAARRARTACPDIDARTAEAALQSPPALDAARRIARESVILLENKGVLPLDASRHPASR